MPPMTLLTATWVLSPTREDAVELPFMVMLLAL